MRTTVTVALVATLFIASSATAATVSAEEAERAARTWISVGDTLGCRMDANVSGVSEFHGKGGTGAFYVVSLEKADGAPGGYVVLSGDTRVSPVVAFSDEGEFAADEGNPLWVLLGADFAKVSVAIAEDDSASAPSAKSALRLSASGMSPNEEKWARLLSAKGGLRLGVATPSDLRVDALVKSKWGQTTANGYNCYNLYTPNNYPCGCVATALAQLLYYWKRPSGSVTTRGEYYYSVDGDARYTPAGTVFTWNWSAMANSPSTTSERQAVGRLCSDVGRLVQMNYASSASGTANGIVDRQLDVNAELGFASKQLYYDSNGIEIGQLKKAMIPSLEAGCPVYVGLANSSSGHAILGDGYGYSSGDFYMHLNMGWDGTGNTWYQPPSVTSVVAGGHTFTTLDVVIYNIYPEGIGWGTIFTGRVFNSSGAALSGQTVKARHVSSGETFTTTTKSNGTYVFILPGNGEYAISAERDGQYAFRTIDSQYCVACTTPGGGVGYYLDGEGVGWNVPGARRNEVMNDYDLDLTLQNVPQVATPTLTPVTALYGDTVFYARRFSFSLGCGTEGAEIRYTLDGSVPDESSALYTGVIELDGVVGESRTVKARAFYGGLRPSEVLTMTFRREEPASWIDERPETHEGTGWWWPERTDYSADGLLHLLGEYDYHANRQSYARCAVVDLSMSFDAPDEADELMPGQDVKAAVRIGPHGGFQVFTSLRDGSRAWENVTANGVTAEPRREYTFRFRLDCSNRLYTVAMVTDGGEVPLKAARRSCFRFANGQRGSVGQISFEGAGRVRSILGNCSGDGIANPDSTTVILR